MLTKGVVLVLSCLGVAQGVFLVVYLFTLRERRAHTLLALVLLSLVIRIGKSVLFNYMVVEPWVRNLSMAGLLTTGPFLWFYGKALFEKRTFRKADAVHLVPFVLFVLCSRIIPNRGDTLSQGIYTLLFAQMCVYLALCWVYIVRQPAGQRLLSWYRNIVAGVTCIWLVYVGIFAGIIPFYISGAVFFSLFMYIFSYLFLKQHVLALEKYGSSTLDVDASRKLLQRIKALFENEALYLDSALSLKTVAETLAVPARDVSQVINEHEQKNFSEFVNQYRIAKAKTLLSAAQQSKIEAIAYDCGFGNVTSFNTAFKAAMRMTPSEFRSQRNTG